MTYSIIDHPGGQFAVVAVSASGSVYSRRGFQTLAEAEQCVEDLRAVMAACSAPLVRSGGELPGMNLRALLRTSRSPFR
ncbi:hypothetical protein MOX02_11010 [Methylobacterium oxalidis]|uniref:DUF1508 domain-containing protein n=1 Tax=Methylobacterium oxalidis TaxID=944322 RepID=A0A512IZH3_9HYPH|nr:hypothetical protein MOX02_11010 [Methylobacterium oxalidis]